MNKICNAKNFSVAKVLDLPESKFYILKIKLYAKSIIKNKVNIYICIIKN
jgi:hypothetical protein